jgi:hypothetical protein
VLLEPADYADVGDAAGATPAEGNANYRPAGRGVFRCRLLVGDG